MRIFALLLLLILSALLQAQETNRFELPTPSGPFSIGRMTFDWTDNSRSEVLTPEFADHRELLVHLFYPTGNNQPGARATYFPNVEKIESFEEKFGKDFFRNNYGQTYPYLRDMRTHTIANGKPRATGAPFPVILFSHGGGVPVLFYTAIIEELVSHGYIVAAIEHSYDGATLVFPDGRIITQNWGEDFQRRRGPFLLARATVGAEDDSFVLNQLEKLNRASLPGATKAFKHLLDIGRAGAVGHSLGGKIAIIACEKDKRFKFCLNLDGGLDPGQAYGSVSQPVLGMYGYRKSVQRSGESESNFLKRKVSSENYISNLKAQYAEVPSESRLLLIDAPGFSHYSYYNFPDAEAEVPPWNATPEQWARNKKIILDLTVAAFDAQLRSARPDGLNSLPVEQYSEARLDALGVWKKPGSSWLLSREARPMKNTP